VLGLALHGLVQIDFVWGSQVQSDFIWGGLVQSDFVWGGRVQCFIHEFKTTLHN
jgi:hypothetical protein